jgi:hypothetical protein
MMNEETSQFEQRLSRQPLRPIPTGWRAEILAAAGRESKGENREQVAHWSSTAVTRLLALLWPNPQAWAGLAAVWILILAVDFSMRDKSPVTAEKSAPPSPEVIVELKQQQRLLAELLGPRDTGDADRSKSLGPRPRSERSIEILMT